MTQAESDLVALLPWDTEFWGVRAARIEAADIAQLADAERDCERLGVEWSSFLVPAARLDLVNAAIASGHEAVDVRITLSAPVPDNPTPGDVGIAGIDEAEELEHLAAIAFDTSRFFADRRLPRERCRELYAIWARRSVDGTLADAVVTHRSNGSIDGFVSIRLAEGGATLPLVAVRPDRQGSGVGGMLIESTLRWLRSANVNQVSVVTQLANTRAVRLYEAHGFRIADAAVWLHRWYGKSSEL